MVLQTEPQKSAVAMDGQGGSGGHVPLPGLERHHNPFLRSAAGGRALSALQLPFFALRPPPGFGVLTMTGRKTGKTRRKCVRAIRRGNKAYLVSIGGARAAWLKNIRANPNVRLRVKDGAFVGVAREPRETAEAQQAMEAYCETVNQFDYFECAIWRKGRPTRSKVKELHRTWFDHGTPLVIELANS
jgi:deazaflavin-dependent oxidoreductase (nitroreductase family)